MNGDDIRKAAINKAKQMASAANLTNSNGDTGKKRRKAPELKPIVTNDGPTPADPSSASIEAMADISAPASQTGCVLGPRF